MRSFQADFERSKQDMKHPRWAAIRDALGVVRVRAATKSEDLKGIDVWWTIKGRAYAVEIKTLNQLQKDPGNFSFEVFSDEEREVLGCDVDPRKETEILVIDYPQLNFCYVLGYKGWRAWFIQHWDKHQETLWLWREKNQGMQGPEYTTLFARVDRATVLANVKHKLVRY